MPISESCEDSEAGLFYQVKQDPLQINCQTFVHTLQSIPSNFGLQSYCSKHVLYSYWIIVSNQLNLIKDDENKEDLHETVVATQY